MHLGRLANVVLQRNTFWPHFAETGREHDGIANAVIADFADQPGHRRGGSGNDGQINVAG